MSQVSNNNNDEDLSLTLIERRKRLHELATEINQWEDESNKKNCIISSTTPLAPPIPQDLLNNSINRTINSPNPKYYNSPTRKLVNTSQNDSGIASKIQKMNSIENNKTIVQQQKHHHSSSDLNNKENNTTTTTTTIQARKTSLNSSIPKQQSLNTEICQLEMINVAKKILAKRELKEQQQHEQQDPNSSVRAIKEKFENMINNCNNTDQSVSEDVHLTPRLLIKKFEAMSKDGGIVEKVATNTNNKIHDIKTSARVTSFLSNVDSAIQSSPISNSTKIMESSTKSSNARLKLAPKYDLEFIDSTVTDDTTELSENNEDESDDDVDDEDDVDDDDDDEDVDNDDESECENESEDENENDIEESSLYQDQDRTLTPKAIVEKFEQLNKNNNERKSSNGVTMSLTNRKESDDGNCKFSLTYVSSLSNEQLTSNQNSHLYENVKNENEPLYEELNNTASTTSQQTSSNIDEIYIKKQEIIKNFKIDYDEEYDDDEDEDNNNDDDETQSQNTSKFTQESEDLTTKSVSSSRTESFETISQYDRNSDTYSISSYGSETTTTTTNNNEINNKYEEIDHFKEDIGIYSIKDYRRQKRPGTSNKTRRSILQNQQQDNNNDINNKKKLNLIDDKNKNNNNNNNASNCGSNSSLLERIKELEELIKHEDNIINQTGCALEQCFHDSQFTGSIEHIECNRLLLIACQKRQSYLTEINRIKQKISLKNKDEPEISEDLSGTLVFSDIQLPIKESYMNKLRNGDEKRIFNFICLLRYGIQVLQTQVISVQELLASKDTIITFPNRMAISNVDVNFKVKIDVYAMETNRKEKNKKSPTKLDPKKFFSPFKLSNNHDSNNYHGHHANSGGFATVKTSNFIHIDTIEITHKDIVRENFKLNISSSSIPLIGVLHIEVRCMPSKSIELRGFLTMFEDVSGYGAWDRRWFMLSNNSLSFWKYPEDEFRKSPLGLINLIECTTDKAQILSRDICARKYTFELICVKAKEKSEESDDSLISKSYDKYKFTKYWLSADTRESANDWINHINWALTNLRLWNPNAVKPIKKSS